MRHACTPNNSWGYIKSLAHHVPLFHVNPLHSDRKSDALSRYQTPLISSFSPITSYLERSLSFLIINSLKNPSAHPQVIIQTKEEENHSLTKLLPNLSQKLFQPIHHFRMSPQANSTATVATHSFLCLSPIVSSPSSKIAIPAPGSPEQKAAVEVGADLQIRRSSSSASETPAFLGRKFLKLGSGEGDWSEDVFE